MTAFACPNCGATDAWVADYYEAVHQSISLHVDEDGEPVFGNYTGITGSYDDGSTADECWRCQSCDYVIPLGTFHFAPEGDPTTAQLSRALDLACASLADYINTHDAKYDDLDLLAKGLRDDLLKKARDWEQRR